MGLLSRPPWPTARSPNKLFKTTAPPPAGPRLNAALDLIIAIRQGEGTMAAKKAKSPKARSGGAADAEARSKYPRHSLNAALRVPRAILEQNAGKECSDRDAAKFAGVGYHGPFRVELSSSAKYGLLERPSAGRVALTSLARQILRPQQPADELAGLRQAVLNAPVIADVYTHYRGENLPDQQFLINALVDKFKVPQASVAEFLDVFADSLKTAQLLEEHSSGKKRLLDASASSDPAQPLASEETLKKLGKGVSIAAGDTCFVVMPFAKPIGDHYDKIYSPAITKAGLKPLRADNEIFGTGKIMDQVWSGINGARVLVAELTSRNANVFYELGLAHALKKPVVLVSSNEGDVPFDLHHIRVIYYDVTDPFWGEKLIAKVAENVLSALKNPEEAIFKSDGK